MSVARFAFGPRLKAHRERQGITLQEIADSTKIGVALLASLERNDVSQWPKGIYRRAFLRSYSRAIDMPFDAFDLPAAHIFKVSGGKIHEIEAMGFMADYQSPTGWESHAGH